MEQSFLRNEASFFKKIGRATNRFLWQLFSNKCATKKDIS